MLRLLSEGASKLKKTPKSEAVVDAPKKTTPASPISSELADKMARLGKSTGTDEGDYKPISRATLNPERISVWEMKAKDREAEKNRIKQILTTDLDADHFIDKMGKMSDAEKLATKATNEFLADKKTADIFKTANWKHVSESKKQEERDRLISRLPAVMAHAKIKSEYNRDVNYEQDLQARLKLHESYEAGEKDPNAEEADEWFV